LTVKNAERSFVGSQVRLTNKNKYTTKGCFEQQNVGKLYSTPDFEIKHSKTIFAIRDIIGVFAIWLGQNAN